MYSQPKIYKNNYLSEFFTFRRFSCISYTRRTSKSKQPFLTNLFFTKYIKSVKNLKKFSLNNKFLQFPCHPRLRSGIQGVLASVLLVTAVITPQKANALEVFYDSQVDSYLKEITAGLVKHSSLNGVRFYLAKSPQINAFATSNKEIVIYSGLVDKSTNIEQVQGILAHELGHLVAQHHVKTRVKQSEMGLSTITGAVLGVGAVIAGAPQAGYAAIVGGSAADMSKALAYSREHENEADSIAVQLLKKSDINAKGLADFFAILQREERNFYKTTPEFLNTHPSSSRRKDFIRSNVLDGSYYTKNSDFDIFKAKVQALTQEPKKVINVYSLKEDSAAKSLALAVAYNYQGLFDESKQELKKSQKLGLSGLWYYDILGQFEYENAKFKESIKSYKKSANAGNNSWILDFQIAESYHSLNNKKALSYFLKANAKFEYFYYTYKRIADVYAKHKEMAKAYYYLALYNSKSNKSDDAKHFLKLATKQYEKDNLEDLILKQQIEDLELFFKNTEKDK